MTTDTDTENKDGSGTVRGDDAPATPARDLSGLIPDKNGAYHDPKNGRIVATPGGGNKAITKETSPVFRELSQTKLKQDVYNGIISGASQRDIDASVATIAEVQTQIACNPMAGRASTEAARFVFQVAGFMPDRKGEPDNNAAREIGRGIADVLCRLLQDNGSFIAENDIIDGEIVENGNDNGSETG
jgi:hypothetical protein